MTRDQVERQLILHVDQLHRPCPRQQLASPAVSDMPMGDDLHGRRMRALQGDERSCGGDFESQWEGGDRRGACFLDRSIGTYARQPLYRV